MKRFLPVLFLALAAGWVLWPGHGEQFVEIDVPSGASAYNVAVELTQNHLLTVRHSLLIWIKLRRADAKIKPGHYRFAAGRSSFWIADDLINGRTQKIKVAIPEGFASWQIAERMETLKICNGAQFKKIVDTEKLEGFLFAATYDLDQVLDPATVAHFLKSEFDRHWTPNLDARAKELGLTQKEAVTLASIIEREVKVRDELPLVSAVYHNRLKLHMPLQADPTVQYAQGEWKQRLTYKDYRTTQSPYNTYLHQGLPPGPICSPGMDAIKAALWPAKSDALYFVAGEEGHHVFSTSYREHTNKVNHRNRMRQKNR